MSVEEVENPETPKKSSKIGLLVGLVLALLLGAGGFFGIYSGMILGPKEHVKEEIHAKDLPPVSFVPITAMTISLGRNSENILRFSAQLEVDPARSEDVSTLMPRILDVLNGYLRAVDVAQLKDPSALIRLRAQMLRRVQLVTGDGRVRDLLITEFVFT